MGITGLRCQVVESALLAAAGSLAGFWGGRACGFGVASEPRMQLDSYANGLANLFVVTFDYPRFVLFYPLEREVLERFPVNTDMLTFPIIVHILYEKMSTAHSPTLNMRYLSNCEHTLSISLWMECFPAARFI